MQVFVNVLKWLNIQIKSLVSTFIWWFAHENVLFPWIFSKHKCRCLCVCVQVWCNSSLYLYLFVLFWILRQLPPAVGVLLLFTAVLSFDSTWESPSSNLSLEPQKWMAVFLLECQLQLIFRASHVILFKQTPIWPFFFYLLCLRMVLRATAAASLHPFSTHGCVLVFLWGQHVSGPGASSSSQMS